MDGTLYSDDIGQDHVMSKSKFKPELSEPKPSQLIPKPVPPLVIQRNLHKVDPWGWLPQYVIHMCMRI